MKGFRFIILLAVMSLALGLVFITVAAAKITSSASIISQEVSPNQLNRPALNLSNLVNQMERPVQFAASPYGPRSNPPSDNPADKYPPSLPPYLRGDAPPDDSQPLIGAYLEVNYAHDWASVNTIPGEIVTVTVNQGGETFTVVGTADPDWWFRTWEWDWIPSQPDIEPGDSVVAEISALSTAIDPVGEIDGVLDTAADTVQGTLNVPAFASKKLNVRCEVWVDNGPEGIDITGVPANGGAFTCDFGDVGWDLIPGQDVALRYYEPDYDAVINIIREPAPYLNISTSGTNSPGEDGNYQLRIDYNNSGDGIAEDVTISATLQGGMQYLADTSGVTPSGSGVPSDPLIWQLGTMSPSMFNRAFDLFVHITAPASSTLTNIVEIDTSTVYAGQDPENLRSTWSGHVEANTTDLNVGKWPWTGDPVPGSDYVYNVNTCNSGETGSSELVLTDTLPLSTTLVSWWGQEGGWQEVATGTHSLVLSRPTIPGSWCSEVYFNVHLDPEALPGTPLTNTVEISAANDLTLENNWASATHSVGYYPHANLSVWKGWPAYGQFVPGGEIAFEFGYGNSGNIPVNGVLVTATLPENTSFQRAWIWTPYGDQSFDPTEVTSRTLVWDIGTLPNGYSKGVNVAVRISDTAASGQVLTSTVDITRLPWEDRFDDNRVEWVAQVNEQGPNLSVDKQTYQWADGNEKLWYNIRIMNTGTELLENFRITDTLPAETSFNGDWGIGHGPPISAIYEMGGSEVVFIVSELNPGDTASIEFSIDLNPGVVGEQGLAFTNRVDAPIPGDVYPEDNSDQVTAVSGPDVFVEKWLSGGEPKPGEIVTFTVDFGNHNQWPWDGDPSFGSHLTETLPTGMTFITSTAPWKAGEVWAPEVIDGNTVVWEWGTMWNSTSWHFDLVVQISEKVKVRDVLVNRIEAFGDSPDEVEFDWTNNVSTLPVTILGPHVIYMPLIPVPK
jgi:uncharacterized repeat protein (TIGR01451 family)